MLLLLLHHKRLLLRIRIEKLRRRLLLYRCTANRRGRYHSGWHEMLLLLLRIRGTRTVGRLLPLLLLNQSRSKNRWRRLGTSLIISGTHYWRRRCHHPPKCQKRGSGYRCQRRLSLLNVRLRRGFGLQQCCRWPRFSSLHLGGKFVLLKLPAYDERVFPTYPDVAR